MDKKDDFFKLPKTPRIKKAVAELLEHDDMVAVQVRVRAAHILYYDLKPDHDIDLMIATLVVGVLPEKEILKEFGKKAFEYARDIKWFQQQTMAVIMAAPLPLKAFYVAINLAGAELVIREYEKEYEDDPEASFDGMIDMQDTLLDILESLGSVPFPELIEHCDAVIEKVIALVERAETLPESKAEEQRNKAYEWIKKNGRKKF